MSSTKFCNAKLDQSVHNLREIFIKDQTDDISGSLSSEQDSFYRSIKLDSFDGNNEIISQVEIMSEIHLIVDTKCANKDLANDETSVVNIWVKYSDCLE